MAANASVADGSYTVVVDGVNLTVYCADMSSTPEEYISLSMTAAGENFSQYTAGGVGAGSDVRTSYTKLRINPVPVSTSPLRFAVDIADQTFSSSTGSLSQGGTPVSSMPYAVAMSCVAPDAADGVANLDLRGTPFTVVNTFAVQGFLAVGAATVASPQVVNLSGGGFCGWIAPASVFNPFNMAGGYDLQLEVDHDLAFTSVPSNIATTATGAAGAVVTYTAPTATDADDPATPSVACSPPSGSTFTVGITTVTCTTSEADDATISATFTVRVTAMVSPPVPPTGTSPWEPLSVGLLAAGGLLLGALLMAGRIRRRRVRP